MRSKTARMFTHFCVTVFATIPMSSRYCAHWSDFISVSKYSQMKLESADKDLLRPFANCRYRKGSTSEIKAQHLDWMLVCHL